MKTSLNLDDKLFREARKVALATGKTLSEVISAWARLGRDQWLSSKKIRKSAFQPMDLGAPLIDFSNRRNWMEELEDDRS